VCTNSSSTDENGNISVTVNCHEEADPQPSIIDQIRSLFFSDVSDPADKRAIIGSIVRSTVSGKDNSGNLNDLLPSVATNSNTPAPPTIPLKVLKVLDAIDAASSPTVQGGKNFKNDGRGGGQVLPPTDGQGNAITYRERDVNATPAGARRDAERIVTGSDGSAYYTADHYQTFTKIR
jgi:guanyl-specific ribonuclease Sa